MSVSKGSGELIIGQRYIRKGLPENLSNYRVQIKDISECGEFIQFYCTMCSLRHNVTRDVFLSLFEV